MLGLSYVQSQGTPPEASYETDVQKEIKKAIGVSGLFSRKKAVENVVNHFEKIGKTEDLKKHVSETMKKPEYQLLEEIPVEGGFDGPTVQDVVEQRYGITLDPSNCLRVYGKKIAAVYDKGTIPLKGKKEELKEALENIVNVRKEAGLDKGIFAAALTNIEGVQEFDPKEERGRIEEEKNYRQLQIQNKILEEIPHVNVEKTKRFGFLPSYNVTLNPGYQEFFHGPEHLGGYSAREIHQSLKDLEEVSDGSVKEKVKALKSEHQKRDIYGGSHFTNGTLTGIIIATAVIAPLAAAGGYFLYQRFNGNGGGDNNPPPTARENFLNFATSNNVTRNSAENFYGNYTANVSHLYPQNSSMLLPEVKLFSKDPVAYAELQRNVSNDTNVNMDRDVLLSRASQQLLDLGLYGNVKVLQPGTNEYQLKPLTNHTIQAFGNYTIATEQLGLPKLPRNALFSLGNATQINPDIVDFEPTVLRDVSNSTFVMKSENVPRDHWMIANLLKERPDIVPQPQKYLWENRMVQQIAWDIFNNPDGPRAVDQRTYNASDASVWQVILPFHDYMSNLPAKMQSDGLGAPFPYYDSSLLKSFMSSKADREFALSYLAAIPTTGGIEGMKTFVRQLPSEYAQIVKEHNSPTMINLQEGSDQIVKQNDYWFAQWLFDRYACGAKNTINQFVGGQLPGATFDMIKLVNDSSSNGIAQALSRNCGYWNLVKDTFAFERSKSDSLGGEIGTYRVGLPLAFKALGIPSGAPSGTCLPGISINPDSKLINTGVPTIEWSVVLPDSSISYLKSISPNLVTGYGNFFGLYSCKDGLVNDSSGVNTIFQLQRGKEINLWSK